MKNITKLGLTALACLVLSACGSSGGGDNSSAQPANSSNTVVNPTTPTQPSQPVTPALNYNATGGAFVVSGEDDNIVVTRKSITSSDDFKHKIVLDGKEIAIGFPNILSGGWADLGPIHTCCGNYSDVRFGYIESSNQNESDVAFYNGNVTKTMPTTGVANYTGDFIFTFDDDAYADLERRLGSSVIEDDYLAGKATFSADFGSKTLSGSLTQQHIEPINVKATINGNSFDGKAQSATFRTTADVHGKFYGNNAKELGGAFDDGKYWGGAFGAAQ